MAKLSFASYFYRNALDDRAGDLFSATETSLLKASETDVFTKDINIFA